MARSLERAASAVQRAHEDVVALSATHHLFTLACSVPSGGTSRGLAAAAASASGATDAPALLVAAEVLTSACAVARTRWSACALMAGMDDAVAALGEDAEGVHSEATLADDGAEHG